MTRCWVCNEEFGVDGVHICANTPFKIKPTMTKVTIDPALIESELKALAAKGCGKCFAQDCDWPECHPRAKELRAALEQPAVEPFGYVSEHNCAEPYKFQFHTRFTGIYPDNCVSVTPVFTSPPPPAEPAPVPLLTDEEIESVNKVWINYTSFEEFEVHQPSVYEFARAIEQLVRRKAGL